MIDALASRVRRDTEDTGYFPLHNFAPGMDGAVPDPSMKIPHLPAAAWLVFTLIFLPACPAVDALGGAAGHHRNGAGICRAAEEVKARTDAVEAAITRASKAGTLKISTEERIFREVLEAFRPMASGLPDMSHLYYPPRFDASEEMEPINKAFADLKVEMSHVQDVAARQASCGWWTRRRRRCRPRDGPRRNRSNSTRPIRWVQALTKIWRPDPIAVSAMGGAPDESLAKVLAALRAALVATGKHDMGALIAALQRFPTSPGGLSQMQFRGTPFPMETFWDQFRQRMARTLTGAARDAQAAVEKALMAGQPAAEVERLIAEYEARSARADKLTTDQERPGYYNGRSQATEGRAEVAKNYRAIFAAVAELQREDPEVSSQSNSRAALLSEAPHGTTEEFRKFVAELSLKRAASPRRAGFRGKETAGRTGRGGKTAHDQRRTAPRRSWRKPRTKPREAMATLRGENPRFADADGGRGAAEELPADAGQPDAAQRGRSDELALVAAQVRALAAWWADPVGSPAAQQPAEFANAGASAVVLEMRKLREQVTREIVADRLSARPNYASTTARRRCRSMWRSRSWRTRPRNGATGSARMSCCRRRNRPNGRREGWRFAEDARGRHPRVSVGTESGRGGAIPGSHRRLSTGAAKCDGSRPDPGSH